MTPWETLLCFILAPSHFLLTTWEGFCGLNSTCALITAPFFVPAIFGCPFFLIWAIWGICILSSRLIKKLLMMLVGRKR